MQLEADACTISQVTIEGTRDDNVTFPPFLLQDNKLREVAKTPEWKRNSFQGQPVPLTAEQSFRACATVFQSMLSKLPVTTLAADLWDL